MGWPARRLAAVLVVLLACDAPSVAAFRKLTAGHRDRVGAAAGAAADEKSDVLGEERPDEHPVDSGDPAERLPFLRPRSQARTGRRLHRDLAPDSGDFIDGGPELDDGYRIGRPGEAEVLGPYVGQTGELQVRILLFICIVILCLVLWCLCEPSGGYEEVRSQLREAVPETREEAMLRASTFMKRLSTRASVILGREEAEVEPGERTSLIDRDVNELMRARREEDAARLLEEEVREMRRSVAPAYRASVRVERQPTVHGGTLYQPVQVLEDDQLAASSGQRTRGSSLIDGDFAHEVVHKAGPEASRATMDDLIGAAIVSESRTSSQRGSVWDTGAGLLERGSGARGEDDLTPEQIEAEIRHLSVAQRATLQVMPGESEHSLTAQRVDAVHQREEGTSGRNAFVPSEASPADEGAGVRTLSQQQAGAMPSAASRDAAVMEATTSAGSESALAGRKSRAAARKSFRFEDEDQSREAAIEDIGVPLRAVSRRDSSEPLIVEGTWDRRRSVRKSMVSTMSRKSVVFDKAMTLTIDEDPETGRTRSVVTKPVDLRQGSQLSRASSRALLKKGSSRSMGRGQSRILEGDIDEYWVYEHQRQPSRTLQRLLTSRSSAGGDVSRVVSASRARLNAAKLVPSLCTPANKANASAGREAFRTGDKLAEAVGIDLGTSTARIAIYTGDASRYGGVEVIATEPAWVLFGKGDRVVGAQAEQTITDAADRGVPDDRALFNLENVAFNMRRLVGRRIPDVNLYSDAEELPFQIDFEQDGTPRFVAYDYGEEKEFLLEQVYAMTMLSLKQAAEKRLGGRIEDCVLTIPANFNELQRVAVKAAADAVGLTVLRLLHDPTAAAIALDADPSRDPFYARNVLVCTMGGGAFDCSLVQLEGHSYAVRATSGDSHFGGLDLEDRLFLYCVDDFTAKTDEDEEDLDDFAKFRLRLAVRRAKEILSRQDVTKIEVKNLLDGVDYVSELSRDELEDISQDMARAFLKHIKAVVKAAGAQGIKKDSIDEVVFVGGCARVPMFQEILEGFFQGVKPVFSFDPEKKNNEVVIGAALLAAALTGHEGVGTEDGKDVAALTLGNANAQGRLARIVPRNTPIPVAESFTGITYHDDQDNIQFDFYQGEMVRAKDNYLLGSFVLDNIPEGPRGTHKAEVLYELDEDGMMQLSARLLTGQQTDAEQITLTEQREPITQEDIDSMLKKRQQMEEEDQGQEELFQALSYFSQSCNWTRDELKLPEIRTRLTKDDVAAIEAKLKESVEWLREHDDEATLEQVRAKQKELEDVVDPIMDRVKNTNFRVRRSSVWGKSRKSRMSRATLKSQSTRALR